MKSRTMKYRTGSISIIRGSAIIAAMLAAAVTTCITYIGRADASVMSQFDIAGPPGSVGFGRNLTILTNGNFVVADPDFGPGNTKVGAVHLFNGQTGGLISSITGGVTEGIGDQLGSGGVFALPNGKYVVSSPTYSAGSELQQVGALSYCDGNSGCSGVVGTGSMQGSVPGQRVSGSPIGGVFGQQTFIGVTVLPNGDFVVVSPGWYLLPGAGNLGAVTLCKADTGCPPTPSELNSLIGNRNDRAGAVGAAEVGALVNGILPLSTGKYVVASSDWHQPANARVGAVTLCPANGCTGKISAANSLIGSRDGDFVGGVPGGLGLIEVGSGNYVVKSPYWTNPNGAGGMAAVNAGAATFCNGNTGCIGTVSATNSMVGESTSDNVGGLSASSDAVMVLTNGNYVVTASSYDIGGIVNAGASVWCSGTSGCFGPVSGNTPLIGEADQDSVGLGSNNNFPLSNGNYVILASSYSNGKGAAIFCNGTVGCHGSVSANTALVGTTNGANVGSGGRAFPNGNYIISSPGWNSTTAQFTGAVTWCNGTTGCSGNVTEQNSMYGNSPNDNLSGIAVLTNNNYVVSTGSWDNGTTATNVGAVRFCGSPTGCSGPVTAANSMIGSMANDQVGGVIPLSDGNYAIVSSDWDNGATRNVGAVTWCNGTSGCVGVVSTANSIYGLTADDQLGSDSFNPVEALPGGAYAFGGNVFNNGPIVDAGVAVYGQAGGSTGQPNLDNSVRGTAMRPSGNTGGPIYRKYDPVNRQLVVGRAFENLVTILRPAGTPTPTPTPVRIEADVAPRNSGNGLLETADMVQIRRFVSGLDTPNPAFNELQRADCSPRATFGNGTLDTSDVVQARRYVSGLDPITAAAGPAGASLVEDKAETASSFSSVFGKRELRVGQVKPAGNRTVTIPVEMVSSGDEAAVSFTLEYDPAVLSKPTVDLGDAFDGGAILTVNDTQHGRVAIVVDSDLPMLAGEYGRSVAVVTFAVLGRLAESEISLSSSLAPMSVADIFGNSLSARWTGEIEN